jgi:hypothetical protein
MRRFLLVRLLPFRDEESAAQGLGEKPIVWWLMRGNLTGK